MHVGRRENASEQREDRAALSRDLKVKSLHQPMYVGERRTRADAQIDLAAKLIGKT